MSKKVGMIVFLILGFVLFSNAYYIDYKTRQNFCQLSFHGRIEEIKVSEEGLYDIKIENGIWRYLGMKVLYQEVPIEVGDSIIKEKNCYKVTLIKNGIRYNIGNDWKTLCDCKSKD